MSTSPPPLTPEEAHIKRSQIIGDHHQEVRGIEKELKKKKLPAGRRELLEEKLQQEKEHHARQLAEFDAVQGTGGTKKGAPPPSEERPPSTNALETTFEFFEERAWPSLSKRELEDECGRRNLSKKGTREDLVSRLNIFTLSQKSRAAQSGVAPSVVPAKQTDMKFDTFIPPAPSSKTDYRMKNKKLWKRRGPPPPDAASSTTKSRKKKSDGGGEESSASSSNEDSDGSRDEKRGPAAAVDEEAEKQRKREVIVQGVVATILSKHTKGIDISEMPLYLEKNKVKNFTPEALGYDSIEEWICNQPKDLLHVDKKTKKIFPSRVGEMPSSSSSEDGDDDEIERKSYYNQDDSYTSYNSFGGY